MSARESLFSLGPLARLCRFAFRHRLHVPEWTPEDGYGDDPRCKRCGVPMWANYAGYGVKR